MNSSTKPISKFLYYAFAFFFLFCAVTSIIVKDALDFSYDEASGRGPSKWGQLKPEWKTCGVGKLQSPIDFLDKDVQVVHLIGDLQFQYRSAPATIVSKGHDIQVTWTGDGGGIMINGVFYKLVQCHWHTPTEHAINCHRSDLELYLVHKNSKEEIAVLGILYRIGRRFDPFLAKLLPFIKSVTKEEKPVGYLDPNVVGFRNDDRYYRYSGSLTTPPCTEGVTWTVFQMVRTVSWIQVSALKKAVDAGYEMNARPLQPLNNRTILLSGTQTYII